MRKTKLQQIREGVISEILTWLERHELDEIYAVDINEGYFPIIQEDIDDENNTYTLDKVSKKVVRSGNNEMAILLFDGSSCFANYTWTQDSISTDALIDIADYLEEYDEIRSNE